MSHCRHQRGQSLIPVSSGGDRTGGDNVADRRPYKALTAFTSKQTLIGKQVVQYMSKSLVLGREDTEAAGAPLLRWLSAWSGVFQEEVPSGIF